MRRGDFLRSCAFLPKAFVHHLILIRRCALTNPIRSLDYRTLRELCSPYVHAHAEGCHGSRTCGRGIGARFCRVVFGDGRNLGAGSRGGLGFEPAALAGAGLGAVCSPRGATATSLLQTTRAPTPTLRQNNLCAAVTAPPEAMDESAPGLPSSRFAESVSASI